MAQPISASSSAGARRVKDEQLLDLRRLIVETEEAIVNRARSFARPVTQSNSSIDCKFDDFKPPLQLDVGDPRSWVCGLRQR